MTNFHQRLTVCTDLYLNVDQLRANDPACDAIIANGTNLGLTMLCLNLDQPGADSVHFL